MSSYRPSPLDQAVAACISVLIGFTALYLAVRLIELIWPWLLAATIIGLGGVGYWTYSGRRDGGW
jgi:hypothetical protein